MKEITGERKKVDEVVHILGDYYSQQAPNMMTSLLDTFCLLLDGYLVFILSPFSAVSD